MTSRTVKAIERELFRKIDQQAIDDFDRRCELWRSMEKLPDGATYTLSGQARRGRDSTLGHSIQ